MNNEKLLALVREYTFLYDISDRRYSDNQKKDAAWLEIARKLRVHEKDCKRAWALLRDSFRRATKKQKEAKVENAVLKKWRYEDEMSFLLPYLKERSTRCPVAVGADDDFNDDSSPSLFLTSSAPDEPAQDTRPSDLARPTKRQRRTSCLGAVRKERPSTVLMKHLLETRRNPDDVEQLFAGMATTVRSFPPQHRARAKAQVFAVVSRMELELLGSPSGPAADQSGATNDSADRSPLPDYVERMPTAESKTSISHLF